MLPWVEQVCLAFIGLVFDNSWQNTAPKQTSCIPYEEGQENAYVMASSCQQIP